jgi:membrane protein implicated in regulation of membrane protease activity
MSLTEIFLLCLLVGFLLSLVSVFSGHVHFHFNHGLHVHGSAHHGHHGQAPWLNLGTLAAFLAWFGGSGYLAVRFYGAVFATALLVAAGFGALGATIVALFLTRFLMRKDEELDPADYEMIGVLGKVSGRIRQTGTGEILFTQEGARKACAARSELGEPIPIGVEVVVTKFEQGIAYVRRWDELTGRVEIGDQERV